MVKELTPKARNTIRKNAISRAYALNRIDPHRDKTGQNLESLIDELLPCLWQIAGKPRITEQEFAKSTDNILKNAFVASVRYIEKIVEQCFPEAVTGDQCKEIIQLLIPHIRSCRVLDRTGEDFEEKALVVARNYRLDGEFVEGLLGKRTGARTGEFSDKVNNYFRYFAMQHWSVTEDRINDLIQDTWLQIIANLSNFHFLSRFLTWASTILRRQYVSWIRVETSIVRGGGRPALSLDVTDQADRHPDAISEIVEATGSNPETQLIYKELYLLVSGRIEQLRENIPQKVGRLGILDQMKPGEIARELGISAGKVSMILFRIREILRNDPDFLTDYGKESGDKP